VIGVEKVSVRLASVVGAGLAIPAPVDAKIVFGIGALIATVEPGATNASWKVKFVPDPFIAADV
jgi:hypothetical protein